MSTSRNFVAELTIDGLAVENADLRVSATMTRWLLVAALDALAERQREYDLLRWRWYQLNGWEALESDTENEADEPCQEGIGPIGAGDGEFSDASVSRQAALGREIFSTRGLPLPE